MHIFPFRFREFAVCFCALRLFGNDNEDDYCIGRFQPYLKSSQLPSSARIIQTESTEERRCYETFSERVASLLRHFAVAFCFLILVVESKCRRLLLTDTKRYKESDI